MALFSIVVPVYNVEKYVTQCLNSIVEQPFKDIEVICVDDGSTDRSGEILDEYAKKYEYIRVIHKPNGGYGKAMNLGISQAQGEYISIVESDDFVDKNIFLQLERRIEKFNHRPDIVRGTFYRYKNGEASLEDLYDEEMAEKEIEADDYMHLFEIPCNIWSGVYRRDFLNENDITFLETPGASYQDTGFWFKALIMAQSIVLMNETCIFYRMDNENSSIHSNGKIFCVADEVAECKRFMEKHSKTSRELQRGLFLFIFRGYNWNYNRLGGLGKCMFWDTMADEYREILKSEHYSEDLFDEKRNRTMRSVVNKELFSFDIFDTLVTRKVAHPFFVFRRIQEHLQETDYQTIPLFIRENFYQLRIHAEELARFHNMRHDIEEVCLKEIYQALALCKELSDEQIEQLCELEVETEKELIVPNQDFIDVLKSYMDAGKRCILISDMYLSERSIRNILCEIDKKLFSQIPIYVSSEIGYRKTSGKIYLEVATLEKITYSQWVHIGDNERQDVDVPKRYGITCFHAENVKKEVIKPEELCGYGVGYQKENLERAILNTLKHCDYANQNAYEIGVRIGGPILYGYVEWLLKECLDKKIRTLYFIARDGYLPKKVADVIICEKNLPIQTKYIYGSRRVWRYQSLTKNHFNLREIVWWSYVYRVHTSADLAQILNLSFEELKPYLPYASQEKDAFMDMHIAYEVVKQLEMSKEFRNMFLDKMRSERDLAVQYLKQEINCDEKFAFVDISGGGLTQRCLWQIMREFYQDAILTFFFKLDRVPKDEKCKYQVYFPSMIENNLVVEMICHAPHGQTIGYRKSGGKIEAVLDCFENHYLMEHGFGAFEKGILNFSDCMTKGKTVLNLNIIKEVLCAVLKEPSEQVLQYFATFPNNETGMEESIKEYAPKLSEEDILNIYLRRMPWEVVSDYYSGTNLAYSVLRCSKEEINLIERCKKEHDSDWGKNERKAKSLLEEQKVERYQRAAYYPVGLLERRIVLYGAGKFGVELYNRIQDFERVTIASWVDKMEKENYEYPDEVQPVETLWETDFDQVVVAVLNENTANEIKKELVQKGISQEKIFWRKTSSRRPGWMNWEAAYDA